MRRTRKPDAETFSGFLKLDKGNGSDYYSPIIVCNTDLPIFIGYNWVFSTYRRTFPFVHAIWTVTLTVTHSRHRNHLLATILSRKWKMFQCFKIVQFRAYEDIYPGSRQRKMSVGHSISLKGPFSSSPPLQSTTPSQSMSPGMHLPSEHSYSFLAHFVALRNGVTVVTSGDRQAFVSSLRSRQSGTPSHTWSDSKQVPNGQRQELQLGAGKIGTIANKQKKTRISLLWRLILSKSVHTWAWKLELSFPPLFRFETATLCVNNRKCYRYFSFVLLV